MSVSSYIDSINAGALALRDVRLKYANLPSEVSSPFLLSKSAPYFGFVDVSIADCPAFVMFSNNDDFVAKNYFWSGADAYEPMSLKLWAKLAKASAVTFDIGSYTGVYSLVAAGQNKRSKVYAFEAIDTIYSRLLVNKAANGFGNLSVYHAALSERDGVVEFNIYAGDTVLSTGSTLMEGRTSRPVSQKKTVRSVRLDSMARELKLNEINLMKIDAEGAEHFIFEGGMDSIRRFKPDIVCEFLEGARTDWIESVLSPMGYFFYKIDERDMRVKRVSSIVVEKDGPVLNTLITTKEEAEILNLLR
jgi:FkbM family methyltransferase